MQNQIEMDRATHTYRPNLPSVTEILKGAGLIDDRFFTEESRQRGTYVHEACELLDKGTLDFSSLVPEWSGYVTSYALLVDAMRAAGKWQGKVWIETPMKDPCGVYAGCQDRIFETGPPKAVWDLKTGAPLAWHKWQLAAYVNMLPKPLQWERYGIHLHKNGRMATVVPYPKADYWADMAMFQSALNIHYGKMNNGIFIK